MSRNSTPDDGEWRDLRGVHLALPVQRLRNEEWADDGYSVLQCPIGSAPSAGDFKGPFAKQRAEHQAANLNRQNGK